MLAIGRRYMTGCATSARRKGDGHRGPGKALVNDFRGRIRRQELHLRSKEIFYEILGQNIVLEIANGLVFR
jgi:hypothetical protein